jgi:hypothetical protein
LELLVVISTTKEYAERVVRDFEMPYPLFCDPEFDVFDAYDLGRVGGIPMQGWVVVDGEGIVQYVWRANNTPRGGNFTRPGRPIECPMPVEVLESAREVLGLSAPKGSSN